MSRRLELLYVDFQADFAQMSGQTVLSVERIQLCTQTENGFLDLSHGINGSPERFREGGVIDLFCVRKNNNTVLCSRQKCLNNLL